MYVFKKLCFGRRTIGRDRVTEVLKFIVAAAIGFTFRVMIETTHETTLQRCPQNPAPRRELSVDAVDYQLREPYVPRKIEDVIEYRFFNKEQMFDSHGATPQSDLKGYHLRDLKDCITQTMNHINAEGNREQYHYKYLHSGYERIDPLRGKEYLLDLEVTKASKHRPGLRVSELFRISSVKPFSNTVVVRRQRIVNLPSDSIHLIVSMYIEQELAFYKFLKIYESHVSRHRLSAILTLIVFSEKNNENHELIFNRIEKSLKSSKKIYSSPKDNHFRIRRRYKTFTPQAGRNEAVADLPRNSKLVFTDLNVNLTGDFYLRCRATLLSNDFEGGEAHVYSPIPYSFYRSTDVSKLTPETPPDINNSNGYWDHQNFQTLCLTKATYESVGAYDALDATKTSWDEDRSLFGRIVKHKIKIIRSVDPAVFVSYHDMNCNTWVKLKYMSGDLCKNLMLKSLGSRTMLAAKLQ